MKRNRPDPDRVELRERRGTWLRFLKLFRKCRLPWLWLIVYLVLDIGVINLGVSETDYTAQLFAGDTSARTVTMLIALILIRLLGSSLVVFVGAVTSARINQNMRTVLLEKVLRLPMDFFKRESPREGVYRIVRNAQVIDSTIMLVLLPIVSAGYTAVAVIGRVFSHDWRLSLVMLAFVPIQILIAFLFGRINFSLNERDASLNAGLMQRLAEMVTNIPLAKAFAKEREEAEKGTDLTGRLYRLTIKASWLDQLKSLSESAVDLLQAVAISITGYFLLSDGSINTRGWISFFLFCSTFSGAITELTVYWNNLKIIQGGANRVAEIMDAREEDCSGEPCTDLTGDLELREVRFGYTEDRSVLTGVNCTFPDHCVTALLGVSGCGKTTLVNLLTRLYDPQSGTITVDGRDIHGYALQDYRAQFVMVSQSGMLFSGTVRENVCYGNGAVSDEALTDALKQARAYDFVMALPDGVDTRLEEYGANLSGGQRQRLAVARALLSRAHYIILDEPAAAMDAIAASELMEVFAEAAKGRCMIVIAHTAAVLSLAQRVVVVEDGVVTAQGTLAEAAEHSAFLREFAGRRVTQ